MSCARLGRRTLLNLSGSGASRPSGWAGSPFPHAGVARSGCSRGCPTVQALSDTTARGRPAARREDVVGEVVSALKIVEAARPRTDTATSSRCSRTRMPSATDSPARTPQHQLPDDCGHGRHRHDEKADRLPIHRTTSIVPRPRKGQGRCCVSAPATTEGPTTASRLRALRGVLRGVLSGGRTQVVARTMPGIWGVDLCA
jgi:hypothetical protein